MARNLRPNAGLRAQARHGYDGGQDAADASGHLALGIGKERAVFVVEDVDGEVRVREGEFGNEFAGEGLVD